MVKAIVNGGGVAALCCAKLLGDKGWEVTLRHPAQPASPTLVLQPLTVHLINQIFGSAEEVFRGAHLLERHCVKWGASAPEAAGTVPRMVIRGDFLAGRLLAALRCHEAGWHGRVTARDGGALTGTCADESSYDWIVHAGGGGAAANGDPCLTKPRRFGQRRAVCSTARLRRHADADATCMEATSDGWLFLIPTGRGQAVLQAVVPFRPLRPAHTLRLILAGAKFIRSLVSEVTGPWLVFDSAPSLLEASSGSRWIAAGSLACSYDPLCGDGTGHAVRGAILAAAVLDAAARGPEPAGYLEHYRDRLASVLHGHLSACHSFYSAAAFGPTWAAELQATADGLRHLDRALTSRKHFRYGLRGLHLAPL